MAMRIPANRLTCSLCGGTLKASSDAGRFVCSSCGSEVSTGKQSLSFEPVVDAVSKVQGGTDKTAAELAVKRLRKDLEALIYQKEQLESAYSGQQASNTGKVIAAAIFSGFIVFMIGVVIAAIMAESIYAVIGAPVAIVGASITAAILNKKIDRENKALAGEANKELMNYDRSIYQTKKKLAENLTIADS